MEDEPKAPDAEGAPDADPQPPDPTPEGQDTETLVKTVTDAVTHNMQSFMGRRDKALIDGITKNFDSIVEKKVGAYTHTEAPAASDFNWEKPMESVEAAFSKLRQKEQVQDQEFQENLINGMGSYMDNNPMFKDQEFGKQVLETAMRNFGTARRDVDPKVAGQMLVQDATMQVIHAQKEGTNALSGRPTPTAPSGSVTAPDDVTPKQEATMPKLSEHAKKLVDRYGYSAEDVQKILGK